MKITPEKIAELKAAASRAIEHGHPIDWSVDSQPKHIIYDLIADLEESQSKVEKERARGIHSCHDNCTRDGCVNRRLREELNTTRKQLAEAQALLVSGADLLGKVAKNAVDDFVCASGQKYADLMRQADSSALQFAIAEAIEPYRKDAERYQIVRAAMFDEHLMGLIGMHDEELETPDEFDRVVSAAIAAKGETE